MLAKWLKSVFCTKLNLQILNQFHIACTQIRQHMPLMHGKSQFLDLGYRLSCHHLGWSPLLFLFAKLFRGIRSLEQIHLLLNLFPYIIFD